MINNFKEYCLTFNSRLLEEWNDLRDPINFKIHDKRKVKWKCIDCRYEWIELICSRNHRYYPTSCPKCSNTIDDKGNIINDNFGVRCSSLINKEWSYRNRIDPKKLSVSSNKLCWWKCPICNKHYKEKLSIKVEGYSKTCKDCKRKYFSNTSFAEASIYYYLKQIFKETKQNYLGIDIYIPEINTAILYISSYDFKKNRADYLKDREEKIKQFIEDHNSNVIKISEYNVDIPDSSLKRSSKYDDDLSDTIVNLLKLLSVNSIEVDVIKDKYKILELIKNEYETDDIHSYSLYKH